MAAARPSIGFLTEVVWSSSQLNLLGECEGGGSPEGAFPRSWGLKGPVNGKGSAKQCRDKEAKLPLCKVQPKNQLDFFPVR